MKKIFLLLTFFLTMLTFVNNANAENWKELSHSIYYDEDSVTADMKNTYFKIKKTELNCHYIIDTCISEDFLKANNGDSLKVYKVYYKNKKKYSNAGYLLEENATSEYAGLVNTDLKYFYEVLNEAGKKGIYPTEKELDIEQKYWNYVGVENENVIYYNPDSIKTLPNGNMELELLMDGQPLSVAIYGYATPDNKFYYNTIRIYLGRLFNSKDVKTKYTFVKPSNVLNKAISDAKQYRDKHNL